MICFHCDKEIPTEDKKTMLALEIPYTNLWFHRDCYNTIKSQEVIYLTQNSQKCYNYSEKGLKKNKK